MNPSNLDRFHEEFWHDLDRSQLKPVEEYVRKYPDCAAEIEKAYQQAKATGGKPTAPHVRPTTPAGDDQPATPEPGRPDRMRWPGLSAGSRLRRGAIDSCEAGARCYRPYAGAQRGAR